MIIISAESEAMRIVEDLNRHLPVPVKGRMMVVLEGQDELLKTVFLAAGVAFAWREGELGANLGGLPVMPAKGKRAKVKTAPAVEAGSGVCRNCGGKIPAGMRSNAEFCSTSCRLKWHGEQRKQGGGVCNVCGKEVDVLTKGGGMQAVFDAAGEVGQAGGGEEAAGG